jgi:hypothetical protein
MSGSFSVPFAALAVFSDSAKGQIIWGGLAVAAFVVSAYRFWRAEHERANQAEARLEPKLRFVCLKGARDGLLWSYDVEIENAGAEHISHCLVKLEGVNITDGKAISVQFPLVLRTEGRASRDSEQGGGSRFNLSPGEKKTIKLIDQGNVSREICINHERGQVRLQNVRRCVLHLVAYGSPAPAKAEVEAWLDLNADSRLVAELINHEKT